MYSLWIPIAELLTQYELRSQIYDVFIMYPKKKKNYFFFFWDWLKGIPGIILAVSTAAIAKIVFSGISFLYFVGELMSKA
jgi:hypothetical protein